MPAFLCHKSFLSDTQVNSRMRKMLDNSGEAVLGSLENVHP